MQCKDKKDAMKRQLCLFITIIKMIGAIDDVRGMAIAKKQRLFKMSNYPMQNTIAIVMRSRVTIAIIVKIYRR